jgi:anaerobic selenocysteine-containing dehydrogenase
VKPSYESYRYTGFKTGKMNIQSAGKYQSADSKPDIGKGKLYLTTYTKNVSSRLNPNSKWLAEISHENLLMINTESAKTMGIKSGDIVEISSNGSKLKAKVHASQAVHPEVAAIAREHGHWEYGNFAKGDKAVSEDDDTSLIWWNNKTSCHAERLIECDIDLAGGVKSRKGVIATIKKAG